MSKAVAKADPKADKKLAQVTPVSGEAGRKVKRSAVVPPDWSGNFSRLGGSTSDDWNNVLADQAIGSIWLGNANDPGRTPETRGQQANAAYAFLMRQHLKDELEGMMAAQLFAAHNAAMECYRRAMIPTQPMQARDQNLNQANKLSRTFATLTEALSRHRGKTTQQKVTVKHVHVYDGGKAAFGEFNGGQPGGGGVSETEDQSHGHDAIALEPAMLRQDAGGIVLPIPSHAERAMPHARRNQPRRAKG